MERFASEYTTIASAAAAIRAGSLSVTGLVAATLERARETEQALHAYAYLDEEAALDAAAAADREIAKQGPRGPLHGIPLGIKDLFATKDMPTEAGSKLFAGYRPADDADVVGKLRAAGAIVLGKQHTHEFGFGMNEPPTRTPWDLERYPGGSTVGGAVSVAVGSSLAALGTDGGGSIRKPASINGVVGFKPTLGKIGTDGILPGAISVDHVGWITRCVADSALLLSVLTDAPQEVLRDVSGLRLGCASFFFEQLDPGIERQVRSCLDALADLGAIVVWFDLPELQTASQVHGIIASAESYRLHKTWISTTPDLYHPGSLRCLEAGARISDGVLQGAYTARHALAVAMEKAFTDHRLDAMCSPTVAIPPVLLSGMDPEQVLRRYTRLTIPFNLSGQPAVSVPCGCDGNGLPVGFQVSGCLGNEAMILRIAGAVETITPIQTIFQGKGTNREATDRQS